MLSSTFEIVDQDIGPIGISRAKKQEFINGNAAILVERQKELKKLQKRKNVDEVTAKRIKRLKQIVVDLQDAIKRTKVAMYLGRPYGM